MKECHTLNLTVTTSCQRRCPDCCCQDIVSRKRAYYATGDQLFSASLHVGHVERLVVTGGEPTEHPAFEDVVRTVHSHFKFDHLMLATDGSRLLQYPMDLIRLFDEVRVTRYLPDRVPGVENNERTVKEVQQALAGVVQVTMEDAFHHKRHPDKTKPCVRGRVTASWMDGRVFGCCVACGISRAHGAPFGTDWRRKVASLPLPCARCAFANL